MNLETWQIWSLVGCAAAALFIFALKQDPRKWKLPTGLIKSDPRPSASEAVRIITDHVTAVGGANLEANLAHCDALAIVANRKPEVTS